VLTLLPMTGCAWLEQHQRQIIYRPTIGQSVDFPGLRSGDQRYAVSLPGSDTHLTLWWLPQARQDAPTLLYLHGTFRNLFDNLHKIDALRAAGFSILAVDYRGWGESSPITPSEQTIVQDAWVAWAELKRHQPNAAKRLIYGHSMGSAVAVNLASQLQSPADYGGLVLESAFTSFADVAREAGWLTSLLNLFGHEYFDSLDKMAKVHAPLLMLHGSRDDTIAMQLGQRLFAAANPPKQWLTVEGAAHSDLDLVNPALYQATLQGFAETSLSGQ